MTKIRAAALLLSLLALTAPAAAGPCPSGFYVYKANVVKIYDADTITADIDLGFYTWKRHAKLRLFGIDAPEVRGKERPRGLRARNALRRKILGKQVYIRTIKKKRRGTEKKGKYGRYLAHVYLPQRSGCFNVNAWLVRKGHAQAKDYSPRRKKRRKLATRAK